MIRTQIYLTDQQRSALSILSSQTGKRQSELIREAVDTLIVSLDRTKRKYILDRVAGMWKYRKKDLLTADGLRRTWDRDSSSCLNS